MIGQEVANNLALLIPPERQGTRAMLRLRTGFLKK